MDNTFILTVHACGFCLMVVSMVILASMFLKNLHKICGSSLRESARDNREILETALRIFEKIQAQGVEQQYQISKMHAQERVNKTRSDERVETTYANSDDFRDETNPEGYGEPIPHE